MTLQFNAAVLGLSLSLVPCLAAEAAQCPGVPAGSRAAGGGAVQIYSGTTPQVYRICKGEPLHGGDCDIEVKNESNTQIAVLEKQQLNGCACTDVEGKKIFVHALSASGQACSGVSTTIWYGNVTRDPLR